MERDDPPLLRPIPRRPYESVTPSNGSPGRASDFASQLEAKLRQSRSGDTDENADGGSTPSRNRSILNLTSSTLFGIYSPSAQFGFPDGTRSDYSEPQTPWGTGAETPFTRGGLEIPVRERSKERPRSPHKQTAPDASVLSQALRIVALFGFGVSYGVIIQHLHDQRHMAPVKIEGLNRQTWRYLFFWGLASVAWGMLLPWLDVIWESKTEQPEKGRKASGKGNNEREGEREGMEFLQVARIVGGFIGIAFAARKLVWRSTLQASLTLSLVNPALWYLFDRTKSGFTLSTFIGILGTLVLLAINPDIMPAPGTASLESIFLNGSTGTAEEHDLIAGIVSYESVGVATWIASVLFCSCICFGNIGRRLSGWVNEN